MAMNISQVKTLLDSLEKRYFSDEEREQLLLPCNCSGKRVHVLLDLQLDGKFLQLRSRDLPKIDRDHKFALAIFEELLAFDYQTRFIKIGRDPSDDEVLAFGDVWLEDDGELTAQQLNSALSNFVSGVADAQDACPRAPGKPSPDPKQNGCPTGYTFDEQSGVIKFKQQIHFKTGSAEILPVSFPMLQEIADFLRANPSLKRVAVEGHTDNRGGDSD